jgi:hypothetical protein
MSVPFYHTNKKGEAAARIFPHTLVGLPHIGYEFLDPFNKMGGYTKVALLLIRK